jgi:flagellar hook-associated protein 1 FlgK
MSLFGTLGTAQQSLGVHQKGLEIANRNIANVNTPGYTRQRLNLVPGSSGGDGVYGTGGVLAAGIDSFRDRFIDVRINQETQNRARADSRLDALEQVDAVLNENAGQGLQDALSKFFGSFDALATAPEDLSLRQDVLTKAGTLATRLRSTYESLQAVQTSQDAAVASTVVDINQLAELVARLNRDIQGARADTNGDLEVFQDQRQDALDRLAALIDVTYIEDATGSVTVTTRAGALLVGGQTSYPLATVTSGSGALLEIHDAGGADITSSLKAGKIGGELQARDVDIPAYLAALDDLAAGLIARVNTLHAGGLDFNGNAGGNFFVPFTPPGPGDNSGAARGITVAITDPRLVAAGAVGEGPGSNANAKLLAGVADELLFSSGSRTASVFYAALVARVGTDMRTAQDDADTGHFLVTQLQNQRDSASGVSLDEEAVTVIRFQKAFQASARLIQVLDGLTSDLLQMVGR